MCWCYISYYVTAALKLSNSWNPIFCVCSVGTKTCAFCEEGMEQKSVACGMMYAEFSFNMSTPIFGGDSSIDFLKEF